MSQKPISYPLVFSADKIHIHHWPMDSTPWSQILTKNIDKDLNNNIKKKKILIYQNQIKIDNYNFTKIKKVGLTIPLFKKQTTMVFVAHFKEVEGHIHVTTNSENYLEIFNKLMLWKNRFFPD